MEITKDTELSELMPSDLVKDIMNNVYTKSNGYIENRKTVIDNEIANGFLSDIYLVDDQPVYYLAAQEVKTKYEKTQIDIENLVKIISTKAVNKEIEELNKLIACLNTEIDALESKISLLKTECNKVKAAINNATPPANISVPTPYLKIYGVNAPSIYSCSIAAGEAKLNKIFKVTSMYSMATATLKNKIDIYEAKITSAKKRIAELDGKAFESIIKDELRDKVQTGFTALSGNIKKIGSMENAVDLISTNDQIIFNNKKYNVVGYVNLDDGSKAIICHGYMLGIPSAYGYISNGEYHQFNKSKDDKYYLGKCYIDGKEYETQTDPFKLTEAEKQYIITENVGDGEIIHNGTSYLKTNYTITGDDGKEYTLYENSVNGKQCYEVDGTIKDYEGAKPVYTPTKIYPDNATTGSETQTATTAEPIESNETYVVATKTNGENYTITTNDGIYDVYVNKYAEGDAFYKDINGVIHPVTKGTDGKYYPAAEF